MSTTDTIQITHPVHSTYQNAKTIAPTNYEYSGIKKTCIRLQLKNLGHTFYTDFQNNNFCKQQLHHLQNIQTAQYNHQHTLIQETLSLSKHSRH